MRAAILSIGNAILYGKRTNSLSKEVANFLCNNGLQVTQQLTVSEDDSSIFDAIHSLQNNVDIVIALGGLSCIVESEYKKAVARYFNQPLVTSEQAKKDVVDWYLSKNINMPPLATRYMDLPNDCRYIKNQLGLHPGAIIEDGNFMFIMLPNDLQEVMPMLDVAVAYVSMFAKQKYVTVSYNAYGIKENELYTLLNDVLNYRNKAIKVSINSEGLHSIIFIRYTSKASAMDVDYVMYEIRSRLQEYIYSDEGKTLQEVLSEICKIRKYRLSIAESVTGGEIASRIVKIPGASEFLYQDIVCYNTQVKIDYLGVSSNTIYSDGVVSENTAYEMAIGLLEKTNSDIVIVTTGYADSSLDDKQNGLVYIGIGTKETVHIYKNQFTGTREEVIDCSADMALFKAIQVLK